MSDKSPSSPSSPEDQGKTPTPRIRLKARPNDEEVGYGKPPRAHQFKPGRSGNPKGRPKGAVNESTIIRKVFELKIKRLSGNGARKIMFMEGIILRIAEDALKGNTKSAAFLLNRYGALVSGELQHADLTDDDQEILEAALARRARSRSQGGDQ